jgi:hypothetical protein
MKKKPLHLSISMVWAAALLLLAASACSMPVPATPTPVIAVELTPDAIYTAAVQTVVAQLTENAPTPVPTETQPAPEGTLPPVDTPLPTVAASATSLPSETPTITPTAQPEPSETPQPSDPVLELGPPTWQETFETEKVGRWYRIATHILKWRTARWS